MSVIRVGILRETPLCGGERVGKMSTRSAVKSGVCAITFLTWLNVGASSLVSSFVVDSHSDACLLLIKTH